MITIIKFFFEFFKIGLFSIGGGLATFPFFYELSNKYPEFVSKNFLIDMIAISESTPGPIGINLATFVGFDVAKLIYRDSFLFSIFISFLNTVFLVIPAFLVIFLFMKFFDNFLLIKDSFYFLFSIRIASMVLIISAILPLIRLSFFKNSVIDIKTLVFFIFSILFLSLNKKNYSFILFPIFGFLGILIKL